MQFFGRKSQPFVELWLRFDLYGDRSRTGGQLGEIRLPRSVPPLDDSLHPHTQNRAAEMNILESPGFAERTKNPGSRSRRGQDSQCRSKSRRPSRV